MALQVKVTKGAPLARAVLRGSLDRDSVRALRLKVQSLLATGHRFVVLDLSEVTAIDEAGREVLRYISHVYGLAGAVISLVGTDLDVTEAELDHALTEEAPAQEAPGQEGAAGTQRDSTSSSATGSTGLAT